MEKFVIEGGHKLKGKIKISGSKNATLPIMAASLLCSDEIILHNVPHLRDVKTMSKILQKIGAKVQFDENTLIINPKDANLPEAPYELVSQMRASFLVAGPLIARFGYAKVSRPGGCVIGARPIDEHLHGLKALGADIKEEHGYLIFKTNSLKGAKIYMNEKSVTATENIIMAAVKAKGKTEIINPAIEPHVQELIKFLNKMGAKIHFDTEKIEIEGVEKLNPVEFTITSDYIEAGTFMMATAITQGDVFLDGAIYEHSIAEITKLQEMGVEIKKESAGIRVKCTKRVKPVNVKTAPFPGFPTDLQPQICALLTCADGVSIVEEAMYENRFSHIPELQRMGAKIELAERKIIIEGVKRLSGAKVMASDIRAGAALTIAGLQAEGETEVLRVYHIDRGYEKLDEKLKSLGAKIRREHYD